MENFAIDKSHWKLVRFGDVVTEPKESVKNLEESSITHVIGLEHIDPESVHIRRSAGIEESTTFTKHFAVGDVLFGRRRAYLKKAAQAEFEGICSGDITVLRAKEDILPELLPWVVQNERFFDYAVKHSAGGLSPRVKFKDLARYEFLLPPKDQQAQLAELLWAMDEVIEKELMVLENLEMLYQRIAADFFRNDKNFEPKILGKLVSIKSGNSPSKFNFVKKENGIPYYKVKDLNESVKFQYYSKEWVEEIPNYVIFPGSVIFPKRGAAIMTNKVRIVIENCHIDTNLMALKVQNEKLLNNEFLYFFLLYKELFRIADVAQIPQINNKHINPYPINLPPIDIQLEFVKELNKVLETIESNKSKLLSSKSLQKSLINQIF